MKQYNLNYNIGADLREHFEAPLEVESFVDDQLKYLATLNDPLDQVKVLGRVGGLQRILLKFEAALESFRRALTLIHEHQLDERLLMANTIRLAHVLHWMNDFNEAKLLLEGVLKQCSQNEATLAYCHFAHQHLGKVHFDAKNFEQALHHFNEALTLRLELGDQALIASSRYAIAVTIQQK